MKYSNYQKRHGTYRLYRRNAEGELVFVKDVPYAYFDKNARLFDTAAARAEELALRNAEDIERGAEDCEAFENLADAACEEGAWS